MGIDHEALRILAHREETARTAIEPPFELLVDSQERAVQQQPSTAAGSHRAHLTAAGRSELVAQRGCLPDRVRRPCGKQELRVPRIDGPTTSPPYPIPFRKV